jgi:spoIIIJ-associated protein
MAIEDKIAAAKEINELLNTIIRLGGFRVKYRIAVDPPVNQGAEWDRPAILVDFSGPDSSLLVARGGELLNALEMITVESVGDLLDEHDRISFDAVGFRQARTDELVMSANVAAEKVRTSGTPYAFVPMNSRERRVVHLARPGTASGRVSEELQGQGSRGSGQSEP